MNLLTRSRLAIVLALATVVTAQAQLFRRDSSGLSQQASIEVLDVGQGDSILIRSPEGKVALIDAGPSKEVLPLLKEKGVTSIDLVVVTHHHSDHYGGMDAVLRAYKPKYFLATTSSHTTSSYLKLLKDVKAAGSQFIQPTKKARRVELGSIVLTIFPQAPVNEREENDNSIGIRLQYGSFTMLLTGDSEEEERQWWVKNNPELIRNCTVLKLAHHESRNGTDVHWLELVKPRLAVASLGKGNDYHHPHQETVSLLARTRIPFLRTDQSGTVVIHTDGKNWKVQETRKTLADRSLTTDDNAVKASRR